MRKLIFAAILAVVMGAVDARAQSFTMRGGSYGSTGTGEYSQYGINFYGLLFSSPTDQLTNQNSAPAVLLGPIGLNSQYTDVTGNLVVRASDYTMGTGTTGGASFHTDGDSNNNVWSIDDRVASIPRTGGANYIVAFDPVSYIVTPKGVTTGKGTAEALSWSHSVPARYFYTVGSTLVQADIDTASSIWTTSAGGNTNIAGAVNTVTLLDISTGCPGLEFNRYNTLVDINGLDANDTYLGFGAHVVQDEGFQVFSYKAGSGCHWIDVRSMTEGGSWGHVGAISYGSGILLPTPTVPTLTAATGGALTQGHEYAVCITYTKSSVGETPCSAASLITVSAPNNAISVTHPTTTPANTASAPTGFNVYACDNTAVPGCTPVLQTNSTNSAGVLAQPTGLSAACTSNCSGAVTYTFRVFATNTGGQSPMSSPLTTAAAGTNAVWDLSFNQVSNAATYSVMTDFTYNLNINAVAGTCAAGVCTISVNTNPNQTGFKVRQNQTVPIATAPVLTSLVATGVVAPTINTTGSTVHNIKVDGTGTWVVVSQPSAAQLTQHPMSGLLFNVVSGLFEGLGSTNANLSDFNIADVSCGHRVVGHAAIMCRNGSTSNLQMWNLHNASVDTSSDTVILSTVGPNSDIHMSAQLQYQNKANPWYVGADGSGWDSHAINPTYLGNMVFAIENKVSGRIWKFCQNWSSGLNGFNSQLSGNISSSGKFVLFTSDMGIGVGVTSGQLGSTSGAATCTDNTNCRTDVFICATR